VAGKAVIRELKRIGGRQPLHDVRIGGFGDIGWAHIVRVGDTGHSNDHLFGQLVVTCTA
jgi:hypothetical protein